MHRTWHCKFLLFLLLLKLNGQKITLINILCKVNFFLHWLVWSTFNSWILDDWKICKDFTRSLLAGSGFKTGFTLGCRLYIKCHFLMHFNGINALCSLICVKYDSRWGEIDLHQLHTLMFGLIEQNSNRYFHYAWILCSEN